ncbi:MAG: M20/M25/M40 family metallo-hydrolase [Gammaproteobacteria bacterium]|nr:M20/M25/M40 family metallo-hydrolase [Gammaproteobacteria bacterium]MCI0591630.1 M20/M25/M40 family metallo-hydrolase [Gammaproteobacteria bacterium]
MKNRKLVLAIVGLMVFALAAVAKAAEVPGEKSAAGVEALEQEAVSLLSEYLRIDTTNPPGNEIKAAEFFKAIFDREGIEARILESTPGRGNIYARLKGDGSKKAVVLMNHMDVVPADRRYWSVDPFAGVVKDGYVWGRGALDMKGMGIVELMAMLALKRQGIPLKADVIFLGVADEEAGGAMGARFMVQEHFDLLKDAGTVLNEFSFISVGDDGKVLHYDVEIFQKAPLWLKLTATGTPGHGSMPRPDSAVVKLIEALHRIVSYQTPLKVEPVVQKFYADTADLEPSPERRQRLKDLRASLQNRAFALEFSEDRWDNAAVRNTISITMLEGSNKVNVIPPQATAQLDVRLLPSEDPQRFLDELQKVIGDESIKIEPVLSFPPSASPTNSEFFKILQEVANSHDPGVKVTTPLLVGFTDCHYFREKGIPCYGFMPFKLTDKEASLLHGNDERLSVENVKFGTRVMYEIVRKLAAQ